MYDSGGFVQTYHIVQKIPAYRGDSEPEQVLIIETTDNQYEVTKNSSVMMYETTIGIKRVHFIDKPTITFIVNDKDNRTFSDFGLTTHVYK
jgi:hypothetical protein